MGTRLHYACLHGNVSVVGGRGVSKGIGGNVLLHGGSADANGGQVDIISGGSTRGDSGAIRLETEQSITSSSGDISFSTGNIHTYIHTYMYTYTHTHTYAPIYIPFLQVRPLVGNQDLYL